MHACMHACRLTKYNQSCVRVKAVPLKHERFSDKISTQNLVLRAGKIIKNDKVSGRLKLQHMRITLHQTMMVFYK